MNLVYSKIIKLFEEAAGPADLHGVELGGGAEAEVNAHVTVRIVAGAAADFVDEDARAGFHGDARADGVS